jgi:hypothetical protein
MCHSFKNRGGMKFKTGCNCTQVLQEMMLEDFGEDDEEEGAKRVRNKWTPRLVKLILSNPNDPYGLMALLLIAIPARIPMKQNATHDYIVFLGSIKLHLCFSAMWERVGRGYQKPMKKFLSNFLYNNQLADNPSHTQAYMQQLVGTHAIHLDAFLLYAKACIDRGCLLNIGNKKVRENRAVTSYFLGKRLEAEGYDLTPKKKKAKSDNFQTAKKDFLAKFKSVITNLRQRGFMTIAHPNLCPIKISVPGRLASIVHSITGENSYGEVNHCGNTGSLAVDKRSKLFHAIMTQVVEKAGYDGTKKLPDLPDQQFVPPVLGTKGLYSLSTETVDNDPFPSIFQVLDLLADGFPEQTAEFTTQMKEACIKLLPKKKQEKSYRFRFHPSILVNGRESLGDTSFSAQAGHMISARTFLCGWSPRTFFHLLPFSLLLRREVSSVFTANWTKRNLPKKSSWVKWFSFHKEHCFFHLALWFMVAAIQLVHGAICAYTL